MINWLYFITFNENLILTEESFFKKVQTCLVTLYNNLYRCGRHHKYYSNGLQYQHFIEWSEISTILYSDGDENINRNNATHLLHVTLLTFNIYFYAFILNDWLENENIICTYTGIVIATPQQTHIIKNDCWNRKNIYHPSWRYAWMQSTYRALLY